MNKICGRKRDLIKMIKHGEGRLYLTLEDIEDLNKRGIDVITLAPQRLKVINENKKKKMVEELNLLL